MTTYKPAPNSKPAKVLAFFRANPDEELQTDDVAEKFGMLRSQVHTLLRPAREAELLQRNRDVLGDYVYVAGPALLAQLPPASTRENAETKQPAAQQTPAEPATKTVAENATPAPGPARAGKPTGRRRAAVHSIPSFDGAVVRKGVPIPVMKGRAGAKWQPLFDKLQAPDESVEFDGQYHGAVCAVASKLNAQAKVTRWAVRRVSETRSGLWRLAA